MIITMWTRSASEFAVIFILTLLSTIVQNVTFIEMFDAVCILRHGVSLSVLHLLQDVNFASLLHVAEFLPYFINSLVMFSDFIIYSRYVSTKQTIYFII